MPWVIEVFNRSGLSEGYLWTVDFETNGPRYPTGEATCTQTLSAALQFATEAEAMAFIFTQSKTCPYRPDGEPNCPLRALNAAVWKIDDNRWRDLNVKKLEGRSRRRRKRKLG